MAKYIEQGKSIFIPFRNGLSIVDSQLHLRMYKTVETFKRYGYTCGEVDVLCEYAPVVRCKDCRHWCDTWVAPDGKHVHGECHMEDADDVIVGRWGDDFCSYGERKDNG